MDVRVFGVPFPAGHRPLTEPASGASAQRRRAPERAAPWSATRAGERRRDAVRRAHKEPGPSFARRREPDALLPQGGRHGPAPHVDQHSRHPAGFAHSCALVSNATGRLVQGPAGAMGSLRQPHRRRQAPDVPAPSGRQAVVSTSPTARAAQRRAGRLVVVDATRGCERSLRRFGAGLAAARGALSGGKHLHPES